MYDMKPQGLNFCLRGHLVLHRELAKRWDVISQQTFLCVMALSAIKWFFPPTGLYPSLT